MILTYGDYDDGECRYTRPDLVARCPLWVDNRPPDTPGWKPGVSIKPPV